MFPSRPKLASYALLVLIGCLIAAANLFTAPLSDLPGWVPKPHVTLGLDLRGGSHLVLAVDRPGWRATVSPPSPTARAPH